MKKFLFNKNLTNFLNIFCISVDIDVDNEYFGWHKNNIELGWKEPASPTSMGGVGGNYVSRTRPATAVSVLRLSLDNVIYSRSKKSQQNIVYDGHIFHKNNVSGSNTYWRCSHANRLQCRARLVTTQKELLVTNNNHTHAAMKRLAYGMGINNVRKLKKDPSHHLSSN